MGNRTPAFCTGSVCAKDTQLPISECELFDDAAACNPAGAVFQDTLEDLSEVDRLLLNFASSSNLSLVRWLFVLGANADACDSSGTTCLHAACRSGSLGIVREFIARELPLDATDASGWTALHVAFFMGRRAVALQLMQSGADLTVRNLKGLTPAGLCSDMWLRDAVSACAEHRRCHGPGSPWHFVREKELAEDGQASARLHFEPFFVPRAPALRDLSSPQSLAKLGVEIFNQRPGQGLAFLVATGCVRDYPVELSAFLAANRISSQVGEFLGEDFSLSQTLRLEYINSVRLIGTGVVSGLAKVFEQFQIPSDLHKVNRLVEGAAQIWWRQHEQADAGTGFVADLDSNDEKEVEGIQLMHHLSDYDTLHQLMLSAVLLHWNIYTPLPPSKRVTLVQWLDMNVGLAGTRSTGSSALAAMRRIQCGVYRTVSRTFHPQLQIWLQRPPGERAGKLAPPRGPSADAQELAVDGWALLVGGQLPSPAGAQHGAAPTYRHLRSVLSEATSTMQCLASPATSRSSRPGPDLEVHARSGSRLSTCGVARPPLAGCGAGPGIQSRAQVHGAAKLDQVWLSLRQELLFLAPKPHDWAPYAFVHLHTAALRSVDRVALTLTLAAAAPERAPVTAAKAGAPEPEAPKLQLVFLLPDGRWQTLEVPCLQLQLPDLQQLGSWQRGFLAHCGSVGTGLSPGKEAKAGEEEVMQREI